MSLTQSMSHKKFRNLKITALNTVIIQILNKGEIIAARKLDLNT